MVGSKLLSSVQTISIAIQTKLTELFGSLRAFICSNFTTVPSFRRSVLQHCLFFSCYSRCKCLNVQISILHSDLLYFFFKKRLRFQIQEQALIIFAERRLLGKFVLRNFFLKNLSVA